LRVGSDSALPESNEIKTMRGSLWLTYPLLTKDSLAVVNVSGKFVEQEVRCGQLKSTADIPFER